MTKPDKTTWPEGKACAVVISVLFDDGLDAIARAPDLRNRNKSFSVWQYGATRGVERLLTAFAEAEVATTWFVPGSVAAKHADRIRDVASSGHDIESHGWAFERYESLSASDALEPLKKSRDMLSALAGREATGFRLPLGNWPRAFDETLLKAGHSWSASLNGDDVPYTHRSSLVEIPVHIELEDRPYFQFNFTPAFPKGQGRLPAYDAVLGNWIAEFDAYRHYGLCYVLQLRPEWTGTPGRIFIIEQLLRHIRQFDDVWITTGAAVARWQSERGGVASEEHPINVYETYVREERPGEP
jgi:peptidoglycan/xylan/chitin deacetylase (PgdA/CDA1 family)